MFVTLAGLFCGIFFSVAKVNAWISTACLDLAAGGAAFSIYDALPRWRKTSIKRRSIVSLAAVAILTLPIYHAVRTTSQDAAPKFSAAIDCIYVGQNMDDAGSQGVFMWANFENNSPADSGLKDWQLSIYDKSGTPIPTTLIPVHTQIVFLDAHAPKDLDRALIWGKDVQIGDRQYNKAVSHGIGAGGALRFDLGHVPFSSLDLRSMRLQFKDVESGQTWSSSPWDGHVCQFSDRFPNEPISGQSQIKHKGNQSILGQSRIEHDDEAPIFLIPSEHDLEMMAQ
jgi:hypothetical protein